MAVAVAASSGVAGATGATGVIVGGVSGTGDPLVGLMAAETAAMTFSSNCSRDAKAEDWIEDRFGVVSPARRRRASRACEDVAEVEATVVVDLDLVVRLERPIVKAMARAIVD